MPSLIVDLSLLGGTVYILLQQPHLIPKIARFSGVAVGTVFRFMSKFQRAASDLSKRPDIIQMREELSKTYADLTDVHDRVREGADALRPRNIAKRVARGENVDIVKMSEEIRRTTDRVQRVVDTAAGRTSGSTTTVSESVVRSTNETMSNDQLVVVDETTSQQVIQVAQGVSEPTQSRSTAQEETPGSINSSTIYAEDIEGAVRFRADTPSFFAAPTESTRASHKRTSSTVDERLNNMRGGAAHIAEEMELDLKRK